MKRPIVEPEAVTITLDRERHLRLDFGTLRDVCREGIASDPLKMLADVVRVERTADDQVQVFPRDLWALQVLLWAAIRSEDPAVTLEQTGHLITEAVQAGRATLGDLALAVWSAWHAGGLGTAKKNAEAQAPATSQ